MIDKYERPILILDGWFKFIVATIKHPLAILKIASSCTLILQ